MRETTTLAPWFGSNRTLAHEVGELLSGCQWVGIPFAGGMSELLYIKANTIVVSDLHRHVVNLACVVANQRRELMRVLRDLPFDDGVLRAAQTYCKNCEPELGDFSAAIDYFVACWMLRSRLPKIRHRHS